MNSIRDFKGKNAKHKVQSCLLSIMSSAVLWLSYIYFSFIFSRCVLLKIFLWSFSVFCEMVITRRNNFTLATSWGVEFEYLWSMKDTIVKA